MSERPAWTPDGLSVTYRSNAAGKFDFWTTRADGTGQHVLELDRERNLAGVVWSSDGTWLLYRTDDVDSGGGDLLALEVGKDTAPITLAATNNIERTPALSPDDRWLAYASDETGNYEIYVVSFPNVAEGRHAISSRGGTEPRWSHSGRELFYRNGAGEMVAVEVETTPIFSARRSRVLFSASAFRAITWQAQYDVSSDDRRFLMVRTLGERAVHQLILVQNFFEELKAKVGN